MGSLLLLCTMGWARPWESKKASFTAMSDSVDCWLGISVSHMLCLLPVVQTGFPRVRRLLSKSKTHKLPGLSKAGPRPGTVSHLLYPVHKKNSPSQSRSKWREIESIPRRKKCQATFSMEGGIFSILVFKVVFSQLHSINVFGFNEGMSKEIPIAWMNTKIIKILQKENICISLYISLLWLLLSLFPSLRCFE